MGKIVGAGLIEKKGKFLLICAKEGTTKGFWNNPGGKQIGPKEPIEETVMREIRAETGFLTEIRRLVGTYMFPNLTKYVYEARIIGGSLKIQPDEIDEAKWFSINEVLKLHNITFAAHRSITDYRNNRFNRTYNLKKGVLNAEYIICLDSLARKF